MEKHFINEKFSRDQFTGNRVKNIAFSNCDFWVDLTDTEFVDCSFYDRNSLEGCDFNRAKLKTLALKAAIYQWVILKTLAP